jgi:ribosomal protein L17
MCAEIEFHRSNISKKNSVEFFKSMVFGSVGMVDKLNKMFDPFGLKDTLDGFPEHLQMTTKDSEIYEELADKYKSKFKEYSVEMRFVLLIMGSAAGFIATKKAAESIPFFNNLDENMKKEMMRNLSVNIQNNIVPQTAEQKAKEEQAKIMQFMMQQKRQEEEKNQRMQNVLKQNDSQQKIFEQIAQNTKTAINKQNFLVSSEIDSEESSVQASASN